jgi:hypothetical protein
MIRIVEMRTRETSRTPYKGFDLIQMELESDTSAGKVPYTRWEITRIEGPFATKYRRDHGSAMSEELAMRKVDEILEREEAERRKKG